MTDIAALGRNRFVLGFRLAGIHTTYIEEHIDQKLHTLLQQKNHNILIINDEDYKKLPPTLKKQAMNSTQPIVITIGKKEEEDIREHIKRVMGIDLYTKQ